MSYGRSRVVARIVEGRGQVFRTTIVDAPLVETELPMGMVSSYRVREGMVEVELSW